MTVQDIAFPTRYGVIESFPDSTLLTCIATEAPQCPNANAVTVSAKLSVFAAAAQPDENSRSDFNAAKNSSGRHIR